MWGTIADFTSGVLDSAADVLATREARRAVETAAQAKAEEQRQRAMIFGGIAVVATIAILAFASRRG
jgi:hypothetical protein